MDNTMRLRARSCLVLIVLVVVTAGVLYTVLRTVEFIVWGERAPKREFGHEALWMDASLFPAGWWDRGFTDRPPTKWVYSDSCHSFQELVSQLHFKQAKQLYLRWLASRFSSSERFPKEYQPRPDLCQQLTFADECYAACAYSFYWWYGVNYEDADEKELHCGVVARYQEYAMFFFARADGPCLTFEEMVNVLRGIDQRFAAAMKLESVPE